MKKLLNKLTNLGIILLTPFIYIGVIIYLIFWGKKAFSNLFDKWETEESL